MLVSVTGRHSGKRYTTPVNYHRQGDRLTVISLRERTWWRNLRGGAEVGIHLRGQARRGRATMSEADADVARALGRFLPSGRHTLATWARACGPTARPPPKTWRAPRIRASWSAFS
jgi:deazaflavin-dependent oxidoreductase (nitroreductase family)